MNDREVDAAIEKMGEQAGTAFLTHVRGGTSAAWLADWLTRAGHPVTASQVEDFRDRDRVGA